MAQVVVIVIEVLVIGISNYRLYLLDFEHGKFPPCVAELTHSVASEIFPLPWVNFHCPHLKGLLLLVEFRHLKKMHPMCICKIKSYCLRAYLLQTEKKLMISNFGNSVRTMGCATIRCPHSVVFML